MSKCLTQKRVTISLLPETKDKLSAYGNGLVDTYDTVIQRLMNAAAVKKEGTN